MNQKKKPLKNGLAILSEPELHVGRETRGKSTWMQKKKKYSNKNV